MPAKVRTDPRTNRLYLDLHVRGRRKRVFSELPATAKNIEILTAKAETIEREIFLGIFDLARHFPREDRKTRVTFQKLYEEWRAKKANEVSPLTLAWYTTVAEREILPFWGRKQVRDFAPALVDTFKSGLVARELAPRTVNIVLARQKEMLRMARERGYITEDVARWVVLQRERRPDIKPLDFDEKQRLLKALPVRWRPYFEVAFGTGLRPSEQVALTWERIDWKRNVIEVREGWREGQATSLKVQSANRDVDILLPVRKALARQRLVAGGSALVFPSRVGGHINVPNLGRRVWHLALQRARLARRDLYNTRHTFATHALASGEDPGWVARMLGHTTLQMLITRYYRYIPNLTRRDGALLAKRLAKPQR